MKYKDEVTTLPAILCAVGIVLTLAIGRFPSAMTGFVNSAILWILGIVWGAAAVLTCVRCFRQKWPFKKAFLGSFLYLVVPVFWFWFTYAYFWKTPPTTIGEFGEIVLVALAWTLTMTLPASLFLSLSYVLIRKDSAGEVESA